MDDGHPPLAGAAPPAGEASANAWRIARASIELILDVIDITRGSGQVADPLIVSTVIEGNLALFNRDPELQRRYAAIDLPPPDELRRPVSISAVAASLHLPYETVRRRMNQLAGSGALVLTAKGALVPTSALTTPEYVKSAVARYERVRRFYFDLKTMGVLEAMKAREGPPAGGVSAPPVRLVNRLISEYMMRLYEMLLRRVGDPVSGLLLLEIGRANAEQLDARARATEGPLADERRRPLTTAALAKRLRLPAETVRRHVLRLQSLGLCRRAAGGWLAELAHLSPPGGVSPLARNLMNVKRLIASLAAYGVVAYWEAEARAAA
jgi:DNA-binding Lrp family transcriptional regulator